jgi:aminomethyltransferase
MGGESPTMRHLMTAPLLKTPLIGWHEAHGGRMVDFAGWLMPVQYASIVEEHLATRQAAGMFDVSHMGRLSIAGPGAIDWLESLLSRTVAGIGVGRCRYTLVTDDTRILDDALVSRETDASDGSPRLGLVVNAGNRERVVAWLGSRLPAAGVALADQTLDTAMIAVQGPRAVEIVWGLCLPQEADRVGGLAPYTATQATIAGQSAVVSRTGYTGEDGVEIVVPAAAAGAVWEAIAAAGGPLGLRACGLGARDTLRLEAGMPLYGHELREDSDPFASGLSLAMSLDGRSFPGSDRFLNMRSQPAAQVRVGLIFDSKRTAREGQPVLIGERSVGTVTSGSFSPTLGAAVAMAMVNRDVATPGMAVDVLVRDTKQPGRVTPLPFYRRGG